ncbi:TetR/AcrR family transcriptional regulator [Nonomuraea sp. ATR24]|uniref:TetR/AcrR family transcriptional regulator n=1 Tax=unclassified Nonomuraea TaxID=2593643 RepID=UPI0033C6A5FA
MARPRTFDEDRALEGAMRAFWESGYEATSTRDLCEATGLGRSSVYNAFDGKRELFVRALGHYMEQKDAKLFELLERDLPIREKVRVLLQSVAEGDPGEPPGCLVVNSMVELAPRDPEIAEILRRDQERRFEALRAAIGLARARGELGPGKDPAALARFVAAVVSGMRVVARAGGDRAALEAIAATALDAF